MTKAEELNKIKELYKELNNLPYDIIFKLIILLENKSVTEVMEMTEDDVKFLQKVYNQYMDSDLAGMISEDLKDMFYECGGEW